MRALVALLMMTAAFAGCADSEPVQEEPVIFQDIQKVEDDKGVIRGVVVDDTIVPVEGATVTAMPGDLSTTTDADGAFFFTDIEPGVYFLEAKEENHIKTQTSVDVKAGVEKPDIVRMMIAYNPPPVPTVQELTYRFSTVGSAWVGGVGGIVFFDPTGGGHFANSFDIAANTTWYQLELIWTPEQPLSESMRIYSGLSGDGVSQSRVAAGKSPLLNVFDSESITGSGPLSNGNTIYVDNGELPVGVAVTQKATAYAHAFQHWVPTEGWQFSVDGAPR